MFNVIFNPLMLPTFKAAGYSFDFSDSKITCRNVEGKAIFEIVNGADETNNILLTKEGVYYGEFIHITCNGKAEPNIHLRKMGNKGYVRDSLVHLNQKGEEEQYY